MSGSSFGKLFRITTWGESHGPGIGVVIDGCPAGLALGAEDIQAFLDRRKPGQSKYTTKRNESDSVEILSGVFEGKTSGTPISVLVRNQDQRSRGLWQHRRSIPPRTRRLSVYTEIRRPGLPRRRALFRARDDRPCCGRRSGFSAPERTRDHCHGIHEGDRSAFGRTGGLQIR